VLAAQIRLVMTDVDGTITPGGDVTSPEVFKTVSRLEQNGVMVGLVSGRTLPGLESLAHSLGITGPIIAENGGVARLNFKDGLIDLGYSRQPALEAFEKLRTLYPGAIRGREDNGIRLIDMVVQAKDLQVSELRKHIAGLNSWTQVIYSI